MLLYCVGEIGFVIYIWEAESASGKIPSPAAWERLKPENMQSPETCPWFTLQVPDSLVSRQVFDMLLYLIKPAFGLYCVRRSVVK